MSASRVDVIIIRGAPGVGKSRVAKVLAGRFPKGAKVEVDALRKMVNSVRWTDQEEHIKLLGLAARVTSEFAGMGFRPVIVVDTFSGDKVGGFLHALKQHDAQLHVALFGLTATVEILAQRLNGRPQDQFKDFEIARQLNADVVKIRRSDEVQVDTSALSPEQTADRILSALLDDLALTPGAVGEVGLL